MPRTFRITVEYDGAAWCGWQRQAVDPSIQGALEEVFSTLSGQAVTVHGSGRTDAGVHALGQVAHFTCETNMEPDQLLRGGNSLLPPDIVIRECAEAPPGFHARYDVVSKLYAYHMAHGGTRPAVGRQYSWHIHRSLDVFAMERAAGHFLGTHDFAAFEGVGSPRTTTVRTVSLSRLEAEDNRLTFQVRADGFLRYMVRNLVGTLKEVGAGKIDPEAIPGILASKNRALAGPTAPPQGLFLMEVEYGPPGARKGTPA
ncbi:MAG: tRNA pseudouridine(38-40) synthase TruA [Proteobacteria bacterium]|nr:tRNA pseudouridine(38-40) synthase TruA [Pseudomonadota bacterium]